MSIAANISWHPKPHIGKTIITQPAIYPWRWNDSVGERDRNRNVRESNITLFLGLRIDIKYNK